MKTPWYNTRAACAAPLAFCLAIVVAFQLSQALFTRCGLRSAGCPSLGGAQVVQLARLDARPLVQTAFAAPAEPPPATDSAARAAHAARTARRQAALQAVTTRFERRFVWAFFAGMSALLSLASFVTAALLVRAAPRMGRLGARGRTLLTLAPSAAMALLLLSRPEGPLSILHPLLQGTVAADPQLGMPSIPAAMNVLNALSLGSALALAISGWLLVQPDRPQAAPTPLPPAVELARRLDGLQATATLLRVILYVTTAALVVGVLRLSATLSWVEAFLTPGDAAIFAGFGTTVTAMVGAHYSLTLAGLYLPAAYIIRERARGVIASAPVPEAMREKAYARPEFSVALSSVLPRIVALLGPLLAGPVGEFLKGLAG